MTDQHHINSTRDGPSEVCLTYIRGLLGGGGRQEELPLTAEALLHHICLEKEERRVSEAPAEPDSKHQNSAFEKRWRN